MYTDKSQPPTDAQGVAELIIAKQRNGPTGIVKLAFIREFTRFENLAAGARRRTRLGLSAFVVLVVFAVPLATAGGMMRVSRAVGRVCFAQPIKGILASMNLSTVLFPALFAMFASFLPISRARGHSLSVPSIRSSASEYSSIESN